MYDADCLEKIGANVKFLRTMRKLRQQDVAQTLGISQTHLSNMECGRVKFSLKQLLRLANLFDCQLECFFDPRQAANVAVGGTEQDKRYTQSDMELLLTLVKKSSQPYLDDGLRGGFSAEGRTTSVIKRDKEINNEYHQYLS